MNVKISYTVKLDEVPEKTTGVLENAQNIMHDSMRDMSACIESIRAGQRVSDCMENIDTLRKKLLEIDTALMDSQTLLAGYLQTKAALSAALTQEHNGGPIEDEPVE